MLSNFSGGKSAIACMMLGSVRVDVDVGSDAAVMQGFIFISELQNTMRTLLKFACGESMLRGSYEEYYRFVKHKEYSVELALYT